MNRFLSTAWASKPSRQCALERKRKKETWWLDQKDAVEFVQWNVSSKIVDRLELKSSRSETPAATSTRCVLPADSTMLLARGPDPPRFAVGLSSGELTETVTWPEISLRSSIRSKPERLIQPIMSKITMSRLSTLQSSFQRCSLSSDWRPTETAKENYLWMIPECERYASPNQICAFQYDLSLVQVTCYRSFLLEWR